MDRKQRAVQPLFPFYKFLKVRFKNAVSAKIESLQKNFTAIVPPKYLSKTKTSTTVNNHINQSFDHLLV